MITEMISEQEALIPSYREKWHNIALSTERIDRESASEVIQRAYALLGKQSPRIIFCDSPYDYTLKVSEFLHTSEPPDFAQAMSKANDIFSELFQQIGQLSALAEETFNTAIEQNDTLSPALDQHIGEKFEQHFSSIVNDEELESEISSSKEQLKQEFPEFQPPTELGEGLNTEIQQNNDLFFWLQEQVSRDLQKRIFKRFGNLDNFCLIHNSVYGKLSALPNINALWSVIHNCVAPDASAGNYAWFDFYISVLGCECHLEKWQASLDLLQSCGYVYPFEHVCFVCDRPTKIALDEEGRLHAEGEPAITFTDGFSIHAYRGMPLWGRYIDTHPRNWQSSWYLEEPSSELRRALLEALPQNVLQAQWLLREYDDENRQRLIQRIGFDRICEELEVEELDSFQESKLFKIEMNQGEENNVANIEIEEDPIILLKTISSVTGRVEFVCMRSDVTSIQEALEWRSYEIDPD